MEMIQELEEMWWIDQNAQEISQLMFSPNKHEHMFQSFQSETFIFLAIFMYFLTWLLMTLGRVGKHELVNTVYNSNITYKLCLQQTL